MMGWALVLQTGAGAAHFGKYGSANRSGEATVLPDFGLFERDEFVFLAMYHEHVERNIGEEPRRSVDFSDKPREIGQGRRGIRSGLGHVSCPPVVSPTQE